MVRYVTKEDVAEEIVKILKDTDDPIDHDWEDSFLPKLAFDNKTTTVTCDECGNTRKTQFQYNLAAAARFDEVVFDWNPDLERLYATGYVCRDCFAADITLHEQSPKNIGDNVLTQ